MQKQGQFMLFTREEFKQWLFSTKFSRSITAIQNHHTWMPSYANFKGDNHFKMLQGMKESHLGRGFSDIAQNITTFPDSTIAVCRPFDVAPAGIKGFNSHALCLEHIGNFDKGGDIMNQQHRETILFVNALLAMRFNIPININGIVYHHWFDLNTGKRTNGSGTTKTCPGTNFFGGNTVQAAQQNFIPLIIQKVNEIKSGKNITVTPQPTQVGTITSYTLGSRVLGLNDTGSDVIELKKKLNSIGYLLDASISKFDTYTENAVKLFQSRHSLKSDGLVGLQTLNAINVEIKNQEIKKQQNKNIITNKELILMLSQWEKETGCKALDELQAMGLIANKEDWKKKLDQPAQLWLMFELLRRVAKQK